jgi:hypothetical protein
MHPAPDGVVIVRPNGRIASGISVVERRTVQ